MTGTADTRYAGADPDRLDETDETDASPGTLIDLLSDEYARAFLEAVRTEAKSARRLAEECEVSRSTVYRRLDRLQEAGLVVERLECEPNGHHRRTFAAAVETVGVELGDAGFETAVEAGDPPAPTHG
jgi:DNA-binding transcriptional ArsR family regulator